MEEGSGHQRLMVQPHNRQQKICSHSLCIGSNGLDKVCWDTCDTDQAGVERRGCDNLKNLNGAHIETGDHAAGTSH